MFEVKFDGKVMKGARRTGANNSQLFSIQCYNGKNKETQKAEYFYVNVNDWNNVAPFEVKEGDYVQVTGTMNTGTYKSKKDNTDKQELKVVPKSVAQVTAPWEKNSESAPANDDIGF